MRGVTMKSHLALILTLVLAACSVKHEANDAAAKSEVVALTPGSTIDQAAATTLGTTVTGEIAPKGPSNFFRFDNPGKLRDIVLIRLTNKSATLRPSVKIYNSERSQITYKYDSTAGANLDQSVSLDPGKSIYVEVEPYDSQGAYELSVTPQKAYDANEPNDDQLTPTAVKFGDAIEASIMDDKDNDWYHFTATSSPKAAIVLENLSTTLQPSVNVYSTSKSKVTYKYDSTAGASLDFVADLQPGQDFYVQVEPYNSSGKYRLTARPAVLAGDMASALKAKGLVDLYGIYFDTDQTFVKPVSATTLAEVASLLKADPALRLEIAGHTDNSGSKDHNLTLSQARAEAVVSALAGQYGIDAARLTAKGYGDSKPVAGNDTAANMAKNRRVELRKM